MRVCWLNPARNWLLSQRTEPKTLEIGLGGRDRLHFGTVRPRVQIPGPRPILYSKPAISGVVRSRRITAGSQFPREVIPTLGTWARNLGLSLLSDGMSSASGSTAQPKRHTQTWC